MIFFLFSLDEHFLYFQHKLKLEEIKNFSSVFLSSISQGTAWTGKR